MMSKIRLTHWTPGLNKVALTKLLREAADFPLNEAHDAVNRLLAGEMVDIAVPNETNAQRLVEDARALGVRTESVEVEVSAK